MPPLPVPPLPATTLTDVAAIGPFFAATTHAASHPTHRWPTLASLADEPATMAAHIDRIHTALELRAGLPVEAKVAASTAYLGLVARLMSPVLGVAVLSGRTLRADLSGVRWQARLGNLPGLSLPTDDHEDLLLSDDPERGIRGWVDGPLTELVEAVRSAIDVSALVLWDDAASALNAAAVTIAARRPEVGGRAYAVTSMLLDHLPDARPTSRPGPRFQRSSCCLLYRIGGGPVRREAVCGDCVLRVA